MDKYVLRGDAKGARLAGYPAWLSDLLISRGIDTAEKAQAFLHPDLRSLHSPFDMDGMGRACAVIRRSLEEHRRAVVYGDYDVDGVCAAAIMCDTLRVLSFEVSVYIPDRHDEGYGLNEGAVRAIAARAGLLVTVDCGVTGIREVALAKALGMRVVVTDHHRLPNALPDADAVVTPLLAKPDYPSLCGAGVAYQMRRALLGEERALSCLDLCALATVADMVPLLSDNRVLVSCGLRALEKTRRPGLNALQLKAGLPSVLKSEHIGFGLAPRLNACGRLESAQTALRLLQTEDAAEAVQLAAKLDLLNSERRQMEKQVQDEALALVRDMDLCAERAIVVCGEGYESGVVGLAAGRVAEKTGYPTVILSAQGDTAVGSARSAGGVDLYAALKSCGDIFLRFGGHAQAAGMTLPIANVPLLKERLNRAVFEQLHGAPLQRVRPYDAELALSDVNEETYAHLASLEPFGMGNPEPVFLVKDAELLTARAVGADGAHLKLSLLQNGAQRGGIAFSMGTMAASCAGASADVLFTPTRNEFMGRVSYECRVQALRPRSLSENKQQLALSVLQDFSVCAENKTRLSVREITLSGIDDFLKSDAQGTLLFCRTWETAKRLHERFPETEFSVGAADDPRAFNVILCGGSLTQVTAPYRRIVLCDGLLYEGEAGLPKSKFAGALLYACPQSGSWAAYKKELLPSLNDLRTVYKMSGGLSGGFEAFCADGKLSVPRACAALCILAELRLLTVRWQPFLIERLPFQKCDPMKSMIYRRLLSGEVE